MEKAQEWAELAEENWPDNFAIVDTVGNAYKNDLKNRLEEITKENFNLSDTNCAKLLELGKKAITRFQDASTLALSKNNKYDEDFKESTAVRLLTGIIGEIDTNLRLLNMFMKSSDLKSNKSAQQDFISVLTNVRNIELSTIFPHVSWSWNVYHSLVSSLWSRTWECFQDVTGKLNYFDIDYTPDKRLELLMNDFEQIFGHDGKSWEIAIAQLKTPKGQVQNLRSSLKLTCSNNLCWVSYHQGGNQLQTIHKKVQKIKQIVLENPKDISLEIHDMLYHLNAIFGSLLLFGNSNGILQDITTEVVSKYCKELAVIDSKIPEPYLFYVMMAWPVDKVNIPDIYEEKLFRSCIRKLKELLDEKNSIARPENLKPLFFLAKCSDGFNGFRKLCSFKGKQKKKFIGNVVEDTFIEYILPSEKTLKIMASDLNLIR